MRQGDHRFEGLDGLRGLAALVVMTMHFSTYFVGSSNLFQHGYLAVDFFFILSGFVLDHAYGRDLTSRRLKPVDFMIVRAVRLFPLVGIGVLLGVLSLALYGFVINGAPTKLTEVVLSAVLTSALIPSRIHGLAYPLDPPIWSLTFEMLASALFATLASGLTRTRLVVLVAFSGFVLMSCAILIGSVGFDMDRAPMMLVAIPRVIFEFFMGVFLHRCAPPRGKGKTSMLIVSAAALIVVFSVPIWMFMNDVFELFIVGVMFPCIVYTVSQVNIHSNIRKICSFSGAISFPIYALHWPVMTMLAATLVHIGFRWTAEPPLLGLGCAFGALIVAWFVAQDMERPARIALTQIARRFRTTEVVSRPVAESKL